MDTNRRTLQRKQNLQAMNEKQYTINTTLITSIYLLSLSLCVWVLPSLHLLLVRHIPLSHTHFTLALVLKTNIHNILLVVVHVLVKLLTHKLT